MNLDIYNALKQPPKEALKTISGGRLKGKTDINPQWRYKAMTEIFGVCGVGWKYEIVNVWSESASDNQCFAFAQVNVFILQPRGERIEWSDAIPGCGGSMLVEKESAGLHANDEGYKMAITDALGTAMKMLGMAADIYAGLWDGTKYRDTPEPKRDIQQTTPSEEPSEATGNDNPYASWLHRCPLDEEDWVDGQYGKSHKAADGYHRLKDTIRTEATRLFGLFAATDAFYSEQRPKGKAWLPTEAFKEWLNGYGDLPTWSKISDGMKTGILWDLKQQVDAIGTDNHNPVVKAALEMGAKIVNEEKSLL